MAEIIADLDAPTQMLRLLQGDVGAGETLVALMALLAVIEAGYQGALMTQTAILARQHAASLSKLCAPLGLEIALLTGREKGKAREAILEGLASGRIHLLIGTHALFQEGVSFANLGLAVVDEQHRFGVHQRLSLSRKGEAVDMLVMTATPHSPHAAAHRLWGYGDQQTDREAARPHADCHQSSAAAAL